MGDLRERARREKEERDAYFESLRRANYERALTEIRTAFVFKFYERTLVNDRGVRVLGPESPDPEIRLADIAYGELGDLGGQHRYEDWAFEWEGFSWLVNWKYDRNWGWDIRFHVERSVPFRTRWLRLWRSRSEWVQVYRPSDLVEATLGG